MPGQVLVKRVWQILTVVLVMTIPAMGQVEFDTKARFVVLLDHESGAVIYQKDADARLEPASMAKLMTVAVVFNEIRAGRLKMNDEFVVSEYAWRAGGAQSGGSTMLEAPVIYKGPLIPPVMQEDKVAELRIFCNDRLVQTAPLFAAETVIEGDIMRKATDALKQLAPGWL